MSARLSAFVIWAAVALSAVFWALRMGAGSPVAPAHTVPVDTLVVPHADLTRLFGAEPAPQQQAAPELSSRFHLLGVVASRGRQAPAVALIAIDGKMPRAFHVGANVDDNLVLQAVQPRGVDIGPAGQPAQVHLDLPTLPPPSTGTLPPPVNGDVASPAPAPVQQQPAPDQSQPDQPAEAAPDAGNDQEPVPPPADADQVQPGVPNAEPGSRGAAPQAPMPAPAMRGVGGRVSR
jgi:general secretion pathway protein C